MKNDACNADQLNQFLHGKLNEYDEEKLSRHLDVCEACREKIENLAADPMRWAEVRSLLEKPGTSSDFDQSSVSAELPLPVRQVLSMLAPTDDPNSLGRLDDFEIRGVVGYGAMGIVLKADDSSLDRVVAIKVMNPTLAACGTARLRFAREAKAAAGILHPNVIPIHSVAPSHSLPYLVMPYIKGKSLQKRIDQSGPLSVPEILRIGSQIAAGLAAAHRKGLIHRDIKPANIMMEDGVETVVITDFGLARTIDDATMTRSGTIAGTPEFMSPEQARGESIEFCTDLFSLGSVMYMMSCGRSPFRAQTSYGVLRKIIDDRPTPIREINPEIPIWLSAIISRLHSKSSEDRPTAEQTLRLLEGCLAHVYQPDRIALPVELAMVATPRPPRSLPAALKGLLAMVVCLTLVLVSYFLTHAELFDLRDDQTSTASTTNQTVFKRLELQYPNKDLRGTVVVDINRGFVEVEGHDDSTIVIEVLEPPKSSKPGQDISTSKFSPRYDIKSDEASNTIRLETYNQDYQLNLRLKIPRQSNLSVQTYYDGYLQVRNVEGSIKADSQNCDISLLDIAGTMSASSYNGDIVVSMKSVSKDADLDFESYNGSIDIALPENVQVSTAVSAGIGTYQSEFNIEPIDEGVTTKFTSPNFKNSGSYQLGKINTGGVPLRIESEKGKVSIRKIDP